MSMYIIVEANNLNAAKARIKTIMDSKGYPDHFAKFLFGENKVGHANGRVIKNNVVLENWGNGNFCFEVDTNIVADYGVEIAEEIEKLKNVYWLTNIETKNYAPGGN